MTTHPDTIRDLAYGPELYGPELSKVYDLLYWGQGKDYPTEAAVVVRVARAREPDAVAAGCGRR